LNGRTPYAVRGSRTRPETKTTRAEKRMMTSDRDVDVVRASAHLNRARAYAVHRSGWERNIDELDKASSLLSAARDHVTLPPTFSEDSEPCEERVCSRHRPAMRAAGTAKGEMPPDAARRSPTHGEKAGQRRASSWTQPASTGTRELSLLREDGLWPAGGPPLHVSVRAEGTRANCAPGPVVGFTFSFR
jgi:hypothetical protein